MRHLRPQEPQAYDQEKLTKLKSATTTSYYDLDNDHEIPFYGTQDPEEYLEWERKMDDYLKLHQVPYEDQVKCATRNFHDNASTWWLHTPSASFNVNWPKTKKAMRREFVPSMIQGGTLISGSFTFGGWHTMNTGNHKGKMGETQEENTQSTRKQSHKC